MSEILALVNAERLIERTEQRRAYVSERLDDGARTAAGQYFTPAPLASFLAGLLDLPREGELSLLDPGAGVGSLTVAVAARMIAERPGCSLHVVALEKDPALIQGLNKAARDCGRAADRAGVGVKVDVHQCDFLAWATGEFGSTNPPPGRPFDACIMNPPYRKVNNRSAERKAVERLGLRVTNLYAGFLAAAASVLRPGGQLSAITPRSFANGPYFLPFRRFFLSRMALDRLHTYEERGSLFADASVLQENVVFRATRDGARDRVRLSHSRGHGDEQSVRSVAYSEVLGEKDSHMILHIPVDEAATALADRVARLPAGLKDLGIQVSTGRVVDFRTRANLRPNLDGGSVPLIYPQHLARGRVRWPVPDGRKPNALAKTAETEDLALPAGDYTLVKRFSSKEERRRLYAAWCSPLDVNGAEVAFENHLNVFHRGGNGIGPALAAGLTLFLNTTLVDDYIRQFSGHTQINASDLRMLRYPSVERLRALGRSVQERGWPSEQQDIDEIVDEAVVETQPAPAARAA